MKSRILLLLAISEYVVSGCVANQVGQGVGVYENQSFETNHLMDLKNDGTFLYFAKEGLHGDSIYGRWSLRGRRLKTIVPNIEAHFIITDCTECSTYELSSFDANTNRKEITFYKTFVNNRFSGDGITDLIEIRSIPIDTDSLCVECLGCYPFGINLREKKGNLSVFIKKMERPAATLANRLKLKSGRIKFPNGLILKKREPN